MVHLFLKSLVRAAPLAAIVLLMLADAKPAAAVTCFQDLRECYGRAAGMQNWGDMWLAGLDCELTFTDCTRRALLGH